MPRPKKVIEKKSPDPVKSEETPKKEEGGGGVIEPRRYKGMEILNFIGENSTAYHIQLENGTSTWVPKNEIE